MSIKSAMTLPPAIKKLGYDLYNYTLSHWANPGIMVWPPVRSQKEMDDLLGRLRFYFANGEKVIVPRISKDIVPTKKVPHYLGENKVRARFRFPVMKDKGNVLKLALSQRGLLLANPSSNEKLDNLVKFLPNVAPFGPTMVNHEAFWVMKMFFGPIQRRRVQQARKRFKKWKASLPKKKKVYLLCTGPSLQQYRDFDFSDGYVIGCNTIVKNRDLMDYTKPIANVAVDPNFFFGPSIYAHHFRQDLEAAMADYPIAFFTADCYHQMMLNLFGKYEDRTFILPFDYEGDVPHFDHEWAITRANNILTGMMLPLAWSLAKDIYIIGADGRAPDETYFWKHDPSSQMTDKLQAMKDCHPRFFDDTDYEDYYDHHCEILAGQVAYIENNGGSVSSLTPSHIPVLNKRPND